MKVYLIGFMGCGKSTLGKRLAKLISYKFIDLDHYIEERTGSTIARIFEKSGEPAFRELEKEALHSLDGSEENLLIATGGGTASSSDNMEHMNRTGVTIYLKLTTADLVRRLISSHNKRPLISSRNTGEIYEWVESTLKLRSVYYEQARVIMDARNIKPENVISVISPYLSNPGTCKEQQ